MKVKEVMTKSIASLNPEDTVQYAAQLMKEYDIGSIPVCSEEKVIGIITDRDITLRAVAEGENTRNKLVRDIMSSNPVVGKPDMEISDAVRIMSERKIRRLPVVESNNLIGIVSLGDIAVEPSLKNNAEDALQNISEPCTPNIS